MAPSGNSRRGASDEAWVRGQVHPLPDGQVEAAGALGWLPDAGTEASGGLLGRQMSTVANKPELDEQLDWGVGWEEGEPRGAQRPATTQSSRTGLRDAGPLAAFEDWRDSRRMRRNLRRGATAAAAAGASAG